MKIPQVRFTVRRMMVAVGLTGLALVLCRSLLSGDSPGEWIDSLAFGHQTRYAEGYSETKWQGLRRGMTVEELRSTLGMPLKQVSWSHGPEHWCYTESPRGKNRWTSVVLVEGGKVEGFIGGFQQGLGQDDLGD